MTLTISLKEPTCLRYSIIQYSSFPLEHTSQFNIPFFKFNIKTWLLKNYFFALRHWSFWRPFRPLAHLNSGTLDGPVSKNPFHVFQPGHSCRLKLDLTAGLYLLCRVRCHHQCQCQQSQLHHHNDKFPWRNNHENWRSKTRSPNPVSSSDRPRLSPSPVNNRS
jgi:hypothetical protein